MSVHRFHVPGAAPGACLELPEHTAHHVREVLRLRSGAEVRVFDGLGHEWDAVLDEVSRRRVSARMLHAVAARAESPLRLVLAMAALKGDRMELVLQKATELGVAEIWPVVTYRTDAAARPALEGSRRERWERVASGAAEQSGRAVVPLVAPTTTLPGLVERPFDGRRVALLETPGHAPLASGGAVHVRSDPAKIREDLGITGRTKGAGDVVVARSPSPGSNRSALTLIRTDTGFAEQLPANTAAASVSPQETSVAMVTKGNRVVVQSTAGADRKVLRNQRPGANISWDPRGTALFALIDGHWTRVPAPGASGPVHTSASVRVLGVPRLPGGPSFLSVSPSREYTILFGVASKAATADGHPSAARPHLYLGRFHGERRVSHVQRIAVPASALQAPMGWLGDNAFVIGTGVGTAWIVRVDGSHVAVAATLPDGCSLAGAATACVSLGPRVLGTNAAGSLLYWRVRGAPALGTSEASGGRSTVVAYFSTWLNGSHPKQLTGPAGTYGPATAAR